jgi:RNA polymerase sigma-70 factor, ECF subfamily
LDGTDLTSTPQPSDADDISLKKVSAAFVQELRGKTQSEREVFASLQNELRRIARAKMRFERSDHTLQPTALVNEAFIKIYKRDLPPDFWDDPTKALRLIAHSMEQILNDYADAHKARKRGGTQHARVPLDENQALDFGGEGDFSLLDPALFVNPRQSEEILDVRDALSLLRTISPRQASIIQLQFYCGLTQEEVATSLGLSIDPIKLDTRKAKAFLKVQLKSRSER